MTVQPMPGSKLLLDEHPIQVLPSLAIAIGLNEAIMLQQIHYWLRRATVFVHDRPWVHKTTEEWCAEFPWWSESTIERTIKSLREKQLIVVEKLSSDRRDRTNYYTIAYDHLAILTDAFPQNDGMESGKMTALIPSKRGDVIGTETPAETPNRERGASAPAPAAQDAPPPPAEKPKRDRARKQITLLDGLTETGREAVKLYQASFGRYPNELQIKEINQRVSDLERWRQVLHDWLINGWNKTSVGHMIARYEKPQATAGPESRPSAPATEERRKISMPQTGWMVQRQRARDAPEDLLSVIEQVQRQSYLRPQQYDRLTAAGMPG